MGGAGLFVGVGMLVDYQGIQFTNHGHSRPRTAPTVDVALYTGQSQATPVGYAHLIELVGNQLRCLVFTEPWLGIVQNLPRHPDNFIPVPVNGPHRLVSSALP